MATSSKYPIPFICLTLLLTTGKALGKTPACFGEARSMSTETNGPFMKLNFTFPGMKADKQGWFLVDTGSNVSHLDVSTVASENGMRPNPETLDFFQTGPFPKFKWDDFSHFNLPFKQIGIIGTNVLSKSVYSFDFKNRFLFQSSFESACSPTELSNAGLVPLSTEGFFSNDLKNKKLFQFEHVSPSRENARHLSVPNIPTIPVRVAGIEAVAQVDSGFNDQYHPFEVIINSAMLEAVNHKELHLIPVSNMKATRMKTCVKGAFSTTTPYYLRDNDTFELVSLNGSAARIYSHALFLVEEVPQEAISCGGIATWEIPAAQIGDSFLNDFGLVVLNGNTQRLWIPRR